LKLVTIIIPVYNQKDLIIRALDSIPVREDIEVIVVNDASTDGTLENVLFYKFKHPEMDIKIKSNVENKGLGYTKNIGYANAIGQYVNQLDSDDYLYTDEYIKVLEQLDGTDIVYMNLASNDGTIFKLSPETQKGYCSGAARFIRREFLGDSRCPDIRGGEDWYLNEELQKKPHTDKFTGIVGYHYNFPREGSLYDLMVKGKL
jgi:glycosyltransferase involved in cell wall biosynthesis